MTIARLYLASQSPRRQDLLRQIGVNFELLLPDPSEDSESLEIALEGEACLEYVKRVTLSKIDAAKERLKKRELPFYPILCADTCVAITIDTQEHLLGKPEDIEDAKRMLALLSGRTHTVHTTVALLTDIRNEPKTNTSTSLVRFAHLSPKTIERYIETTEPMGKAGAYGIQGLASCFIEHISGSYSGIMGLPLDITAAMLSEAQISYRLHDQRS